MTMDRFLLLFTRDLFALSSLGCQRHAQ